MVKRFKIYTIEELSTIIGFTPQTLFDVSNNIKSYFYYKRIKKGAKIRVLTIPHGKLKAIQKELNKNLFQKAVLPIVIKGGRKKISIFKNAEVHCGQKLVATLDIKNFYPSISSKRVYKVLISRGFSSIVADILVKLTTCNGRVPLGFLTSPSVANIVLASMAYRFERLSEQHNLVCSFWVDDIAFSGSIRVEKLENLFRKIVCQEGFEINEVKAIKFMTSSSRQAVTKLTLNSGRPKVMREYRRLLRTLLHKCIVEGPKDQTDDCLKKFRRSLLGKISYVGSIDKEQGVRLKGQFTKILWS